MPDDFALPDGTPIKSTIKEIDFTRPRRKGYIASPRGFKIIQKVVSKENNREIYRDVVERICEECDKLFIQEFSYRPDKVCSDCKDNIYKE